MNGYISLVYLVHGGPELVQPDSELRTEEEYGWWRALVVDGGGTDLP